MGHFDPVALTLHESIHFTSNPSPNSTAEMAWATVDSHPRGLGRVHLGADHRVFNVAFYHQLHCLQAMHGGFIDRDHPRFTAGHIQHCLNYLRQSFLCEAADTLEPGDFLQRDYAVQRFGGTMVCDDWEMVYNSMEENFEEWMASKKNEFA